MSRSIEKAVAVEGVVEFNPFPPQESRLSWSFFGAPPSERPRPYGSLPLAILYFTMLYFTILYYTILYYEPPSLREKEPLAVLSRELDDFPFAVVVLRVHRPIITIMIIMIIIIIMIIMIIMIMIIMLIIVV